ncbi:hypothetical protein ALC60_13775 [Trachymyrmex zeteki]|uniref:Integrase catalytic domain-containing protein n=1 Tax=Mycetomoellerius zeteki TaxID=64791 RepID=A0A151WHC4_9HYME|nr:hypothetical protein ALC60_13775 [Trachymyrmex zeteki]
MNSNNIVHRRIAIAAPWANGLVERVNKFLKSTLQKLVDEPSNWKHFLGKAMYIINNTFHQGIKTTPAKLLVGYDLRGRSDSSFTEFVKEIAQIDSDLERQCITNREAAVEATRQLQNYNKQYYDRRHRRPTLYKKDDLVFVKDNRPKPGVNQKLRSKYRGSYMVTKVLDKNRYLVQDILGFNLTTRSYDSVLSPDRLKLWIRPISDDTK